jgi:hypothetical protein
MEQQDFALSREMGVSYLGTAESQNDLAIAGKSPAGSLPAPSRIRNLVRARPAAGKTLLGVPWDGTSYPLLHVNTYGKGKIAYLASLDSVELTRNVMDWLSGPPPAAVEGPGGKQVVLTYQPRQGRWILHLISEGDYTVQLRGDHVPVHRISASYPEGNWNWRADRTAIGMRVKVSGPVGDRLLVLE